MVVAVVVLALLAWGLTRKGRAVPNLAPKSPPKADVPASVTPPVSVPASPQPKDAAVVKSALAPSFDDIDDEDELGDDNEIDMTLVKAFPPSPGAAEPAPKVDGSTVSTVDVMYEEDAHPEEVTFPSARMLVHAAGQSDQGRERSRNEDSMLVFPDRSLFVVADGMGGHKGGNVASALAVDTLRAAFEKNVFTGQTESSAPVPPRALELARGIQMANQAILERAQGDETLANMGTTVVAARFSPNKQRVYVGHVGDSRCYRLRGTTLLQLTQDHTMSELGVKGPDAAALYQAVGVFPQIAIDVIIDKPRANDVYLLCSDGLSKMAKDEDIRVALVAESSLESRVRGLIELANERGGKDNVTVILIQILDRL